MARQSIGVEGKSEGAICIEWLKPPHPAAATFARGRNGHGGGC